jgi:hypothetical protein
MSFAEGLTRFNGTLHGESTMTLTDDAGVVRAKLKLVVEMSGLVACVGWAVARGMARGIGGGGVQGILGGTISRRNEQEQTSTKPNIQHQRYGSCIRVSGLFLDSHGYLTP